MERSVGGWVVVSVWVSVCGVISVVQVINNRAQYVRIGESNRSVERHFTVNSVACHLTDIC